MRTCNYSDVLAGSAALAGLGSGDVGAAEFALFRTFHDRRLQAAWEIHRWPELCPVEKRYFRPLWDSTTSYAATDERFDVASNKYFQSLQAANLNHAPTTAGVENSAYWAACAAAYSANDWATLTVYAVGNQVRNPATNEFYQCITAHTAGATFDATKFGILTPFERYVAYVQTADTGTAPAAIGEYVRATDKNPYVTTKLTELPFDLSPLGAHFVRVLTSLTFIWLEYRVRRPALSGDAWDSTTVYASGQQVYFVDSVGVGNFWTANATTAAAESPTTTPSKWDVVELPYIFRGYLIQAGYVDWLTADGQASKAMLNEPMAQGYLELEADKLQRQQQQTRRFNWAA